MRNKQDELFKFIKEWEIKIMMSLTETLKPLLKN